MRVMNSKQSDIFISRSRLIVYVRSDSVVYIWFFFMFRHKFILNSFQHFLINIIYSIVELSFYWKKMKKYFLDFLNSWNRFRKINFQIPDQLKIIEYPMLKLGLRWKIALRKFIQLSNFHFSLSLVATKKNFAFI